MHGNSESRNVPCLISKRIVVLNMCMNAWFLLALMTGLTSGMSLVWMQSMGLPTYCEADTMMEKASMHVVVRR